MEAVGGETGAGGVGRGGIIGTEMPIDVGAG